MDIEKEVKEQIDKQVQATRSIFWQYRDKYLTSSVKKYIIIVISVLILAISLVFIGKWYSMREANSLVNAVRQEWQVNNRALLDNIVRLQIKQEEMNKQFEANKIELETLKKKKYKETVYVFKSGNTKDIASYFDNVIDNYTPNR